MQESDYQPLYKSNRKAKPDEDQKAVDDMCGQHCTAQTLCLQIDGDHRDPVEIAAWGHGAMLAFKTGKKVAGRLLDGRTHDETPEAAATLPYDVARCSTTKCECPHWIKCRCAQDACLPTYQAYSMLKGGSDCPDFIGMEN
jgi:hypothetical protein